MSVGYYLIQNGENGEYIEYLDIPDEYQEMSNQYRHIMIESLSNIDLSLMEK